jgi:GNAT superfamily N-acetyltransferase
VIIRQAKYREILTSPNAHALLEAYAKECSIPELGGVAPDEQMYELMEQSPNFTCMGVFEGGLIGFATVLCYTVPHYSKRLATVESLFVHPDHRAGGAGIFLMRRIEEYAKGQDCVAVMYSAPANSQFEKVLSLSKDYMRTNSVFMVTL